MICALDNLVMDSVANRIRRWLDEIPVGQAGFAKLAGVSANTITNIMQSKTKRIRSDVWPRIEAALKKTRDVAMEELARHHEQSPTEYFQGSLVRGSTVTVVEDDEMRREIGGFAQVLAGEALAKVWTLAREECRTQLSKAVSKPGRRRFEIGSPGSVKPGEGSSIAPEPLHASDEAR